MAEGKFKDEIVPVEVKQRKKTVIVDTDEGPRPGTTAESLAGLRCCSGKEGGVVTAGNASGINDGAAAVVVMSEEKAKELKNKYANIDIYKADVSKREEVHNMIKSILEKYKKIDVLVNNAGISLTGLFTDVTDEEWNKIINNDLYSVFCTTQEVLTNMIMRKEGCIINISSIWGIVGSSCESIYSVAKAGVDGMTKSLAKELGPSNIRVNSIAPGIIDTEMNNCYSAEEIEAIKEEIPLERIGKKGDISKCIEWLIEDEYTTGQIISINGGWVIR